MKQHKMRWASTKLSLLKKRNALKYAVFSTKFGNTPQVRVVRKCNLEDTIDAVTIKRLVYDSCIIANCQKCKLALRYFEFTNRLHKSVLAFSKWQFAPTQYRYNSSYSFEVKLRRISIFFSIVMFLSLINVCILFIFSISL